DGQRVLSSSDDQTARLWDAATGYPLSEPLRHPGRVLRSEFSSDEERIGTTSVDGTFQLWELPRPASAPPAWFAELLEALAGKRLNATGDMETVLADKLQQLEKQLENSSGTDFYSRWARWFFSDRMHKGVSPFRLD